MQILVVRHAPAEDLSDASSSDALRRLTPKGSKLFREFIQRLNESDLSPELILHSQLVRAEQTAEILRDVTGLKTDQMLVEPILNPGMSAAKLAQLLQGLRVERVAIVGHNPDVSQCTSQLIGGGLIEFKKGSIACIDFVGQVRPGLGRLSWFISPKVLVDD